MVAMTRPRLPRWRDPVDVVNAVWSTATLLPPVSTGAAAAYRTLYMTARRAVLGRTLTVPLPGGDVRLTVTELSSRLDPRRLALGQGEDVRLTASDIRWQNGVFERATALLRNVQLRPGAPPTLRAQAVELTVEVGSDSLADLLASVTRRWTGEIDDAGVVRLRWARRPRWANVEVDAAVEDGPGPAVLRLRPRALAIGARRWALPARTREYRVAFTPLPADLRVTDVRFESRLLRVQAELPQWRARVPLRFLPPSPAEDPGAAQL